MVVGGGDEDGDGLFRQLLDSLPDRHDIGFVEQTDDINPDKCNIRFAVTDGEATNPYGVVDACCRSVVPETCNEDWAVKGRSDISLC